MAEAGLQAPDIPAPPPLPAQPHPAQQVQQPTQQAQQPTQQAQQVHLIGHILSQNFQGNQRRCRSSFM